jgi:hypothetical protein
MASPADLPHDDPDFPHGTYQGYNRGKCRCDPCHKEYRVKKTAAQRRARRKEPLLRVKVPTARAHAHLRDLQRRFPSALVSTFARAADGLDPHAVRRALDGPDATITADAEKRILAIGGADVAAQLDFIRSDRAWQILNSLRAQGWPITWITARLGSPGARSMSKLKDHPPTVSMDTHRAMLALASEVGDAEGPSNSARIRARNKGWLPLRCYGPDGRLLPAQAPEPAQAAPQPAEVDPDLDDDAVEVRVRKRHEVAALGRLAALYATAFTHVSPDKGQKRFRTRIHNQHWERLHVRPTWEGLLDGQLILPPDGGRFWAIIRRHVEQLPVSWAVAGTAIWTVDDIDIDYHGQEAELALWTDLAHECGHGFAHTCPRRDAERFEALLSVEPGTWEGWLIDQNPPPRPGTVTQLPNHRKPGTGLRQGLRQSA